VIALAQNQLAGAVALQKTGAAVALESHEQIADILSVARSAELTNKMLAKLSRAAATVTDGQGCTRATNYMIDSIYA
jgi:spore coat polysaccharide biosynthesis predicted glycosyltransferase SpsG